MKRHAPDEIREPLPPLFALAEQEAARARAEVGMGRAAEKAERVAAGWEADALETVRRFALTRQSFLAEQAGIVVPPGADPRAVGSILVEAKRRGWIAHDGYAPANSSNRAPKSKWRSLIYEGAA